MGLSQGHISSVLRTSFLFSYFTFLINGCLFFHKMGIILVEKNIIFSYLVKIKNSQANWEPEPQETGRRQEAQTPWKQQGALKAVAIHWNSQDAQVASQTSCIKIFRGGTQGWLMFLKLLRLLCSQDCATKVDTLALELCYSKSGLKIRGISFTVQMARNAESQVLSQTCWVRICT